LGLRKGDRWVEGEREKENENEQRKGNEIGREQE
jgi:hypothetical protein